MKGAIMEGGVPFNRAHGMNAFEYPSLDQRFNEVFNKAMFNSTMLLMKKILESYKGFEHINRLVDVGGGLGVNLGLITSKYPHIQGINFDLPHVIEHALIYNGMILVSLSLTCCTCFTVFFNMHCCLKWLTFLMLQVWNMWQETCLRAFQKGMLFL